MKAQFVLAFGLLAAFAHLSSASPLAACRTDMCGGFAGFQCCAGYVCKMPKQEGPIHVADQTGKCEKADIHLPVCRTDMCGGIAGFQCCAGYHCVMKHEPQTADQAGKCVKNEVTTFPVCRTDHCGGIAGFKCCAGYECKMTDTFPDAMGTCQKKA